MAIKMQTKINFGSKGFKIQQTSTPILLIGSCFTERIGEKLKESGFEVMINPFGTVYNPITMSELMTRVLTSRKMQSWEVFQDENQQMWHSWLHDSSFSAPTRDECTAKCEEAFNRVHSFIQKSPLLIFTFGTARLHSLSSSMVVGNCHKQSRNFYDRLMTVGEGTKAFCELMQILENETIIKGSIFTVSPVRHMLDGAHGNQLSKSTLLLTTEEIVSQPSKEPRIYFPSYELLMDELRDYRFYADDMIHPSQLAVEVIWDRFKEGFFHPEATKLAFELEGYLKWKKHRPLFPDCPEALRQAKNWEEKGEMLRKFLPWIC